MAAVMISFSVFRYRASILLDFLYWQNRQSFRQYVEKYKNPYKKILFPKYLSLTFLAAVKSRLMSLGSESPRRHFISFFFTG